MIFMCFVITLIIIYIAIYIYFDYQYANMTYVRSDIDNKFYLVQNRTDKQEATNMLAKIMQKITYLASNLYKKKEEYKDYKEYIERLYENVPNIILLESTEDSVYTSYSVNKGEQIVFCLRARTDDNRLHDINLVMYVVLHEISHVACPIYDNHGPLFRKIFAFITSSALKIGVYKKIAFDEHPEEYCGLTINDSII